MNKKGLINVPVVYMARGVMILMRANQFRGLLEGVELRNWDGKAGQVMHTLILSNGRTTL